MFFCGLLKLSLTKGSQIENKKNLKSLNALVDSCTTIFSILFHIVKRGWNEMHINQRPIFIVRASIYFLDTAMLTNHVIIVSEVYEIF